MTEKVSIEEQRKLISIVAYKDKLERLQITESVLDEIRNNLVAKLETMIIPLGQDVVRLNETKTEIEDIIYDDVWDDIYDDNTTLHFKNYMSYTKDYDLKKEQIIMALAESVIQILQKTTDLEISPKRYIPREDEIALTEEERQFLKNRATRLVIQYKKFKDDGVIKYARVYSGKLYAMADTEEKFEFINKIFFDIVGEYVLDKIRKEKDKEKQEAS